MALVGLSLLSVTASAQPKGPVARQSPEEMIAAFEKDVDALFAPGGLTAEQAASRAVTASPTVRRRAAEVEAAIASAEAAELARVPQIGGRLAYTRLSDVDLPEISFGGMGFSFPVVLNNYSATAQINVPLSDYLLRYPNLIAGARLGLETAKLSKQSSQIDAGQEARLAYYEWLRANLQVLIAKRQLVQVSATVGQIRALAEAQRLSKADLMRVESQEAQAQQVLDQLENLADLREEQVRLLIGARADENLALGEDVRGEIGAPTPSPLDQLMAQATRQRLGFRVLDTGIAAREKQRKAEKASQYPRLSAFASLDYSNPNQRIFPTTEEFNLTWAAGLQVTWTLNDLLIARTTDRRIAAETAQLRADRENLERGTRLEVLAAQQAVDLAQRALATTAKGLAASQEGYRVRRELLNADRATVVELVDAETDLTRARINALNARVDLRVALVQLAHALGNDAASAR